MLLDIMEPVFEGQFLSFQESRIPCDLRPFKTSQAVLCWACRSHYVFCEPGRAHWCLERAESKSKPQRRRSRFPSNPSYGCSIHPSRGTQVACTISWRCTQWKVASNKFLDMSRSRQASRCRRWSECFRAWYLDDRSHFGACDRWISAPNTSFISLFVPEVDFAYLWWLRTYSFPLIRKPRPDDPSAHRRGPPAAKLYWGVVTVS